MLSAIGRRQMILNELMCRRYETVQNFAAEFDVSERTIRRDIDILSHDYPIYTEQGRGGGIRVKDGFYTERRWLTVSEESLLRRLSLELSPDDKRLMDNILATFARP